MAAKMTTKPTARNASKMVAMTGQKTLARVAWPKTLGISIGPHLHYRKYMETIGADMFQVPHHVAYKQLAFGRALNFIRTAFKIPMGYDHYISESCFYYPVSARKIGRINGKIIDLCASPVYYYMNIKRISGVGRRVLLGLLKEVDGFLFEGEFVGDVVRKLGIDKPYGVIYTYVRPDRVGVLSRMKPNLKSKNISITATNDYFYKGLDLLLEAMKLVNELDPEITLTIAPNKDIDFAALKHLMADNVKINYDVPSMLKQTALYVHPSRGDVFPTAPLEAMLAGVPTIVSSHTGTREVVEKISGDMVVDINAKAIADAIMDYFSLSSAKRVALSRKARNAAKYFNEKIQAERFKKEHKKLLKEM